MGQAQVAQLLLVVAGQQADLLLAPPRQLGQLRLVLLLPLAEQLGLALKFGLHGLVRGLVGLALAAGRGLLTADQLLEAGQSLQGAASVRGHRLVHGRQSAQLAALAAEQLERAPLRGRQGGQLLVEAVEQPAVGRGHLLGPPGAGTGAGQSFLGLGLCGLGGKEGRAEAVDFLPQGRAAAAEGAGFLLYRELVAVRGLEESGLVVAQCARLIQLGPQYGRPLHLGRGLGAALPQLQGEAVDGEKGGGPAALQLLGCGEEIRVEGRGGLFSSLQGRDLRGQAGQLLLGLGESGLSSLLGEARGGQLLLEAVQELSVLQGAAQVLEQLAVLPLEEGKLGAQPVHLLALLLRGLFQLAHSLGRLLGPLLLLTTQSAGALTEGEGLGGAVVGGRRGRGGEGGAERDVFGEVLRPQQLLLRGLLQQSAAEVLVVW